MRNYDEFVKVAFYRGDTGTSFTPAQKNFVNKVKNYSPVQKQNFLNKLWDGQRSLNNRISGSLVAGINDSSVDRMAGQAKSIGNLMSAINSPNKL